jgi:hypothetical protein
MKFPSLKSVGRSAKEAFLRFPLVLATGVLGSLLCILNKELGWLAKQQATWLEPLFMTLGLGISLLLALQIFGEARKWSWLKRWLLQGAGVAALACFYLAMRPPLRGEDVLRFFLTMACTHLLVSLSILANPGIGANGFWQFNRAIFLRILLAVLYSATLYLGLVLAILSVDKLFTLKLSGNIYWYLWFTVVGVFNTWFFLAGVPKDFTALEESQGYPKGLQLFSQYVLIPLVTLYIGILLAYTIKILFQWELPKGWVAYLVLAASLFGILSLLLVYPFSQQKEHLWIKVYSRWYYFALLPLVILMGIGISRRVWDYGLTQNRYLVIVLTVWLMAMALYFSFSHLKNIKIIPLSLCLVSIFSAWGPWSAAPVSEYFQGRRFGFLIQKLDLLKNGTLNDTPKAIPFESEKQLNSIVQYLGENHGYRKIKKWFGPNAEKLDLVDRGEVAINEFPSIMKMMGLSYIPSYQKSETAELNYFSLETKEGPFFTRGYDLLLGVNRYIPISLEGEPWESRTPLGRAWVAYATEKDELTIKFEDSPILTFHVIPLLKKFQKPHSAKAGPHGLKVEYGLDPESMVLEGENAGLKVKIYVRNIQGTVEGEKIELSNLSLAVLLKIK